MDSSILLLRVPRTSENTPEQTAQLLTSLARASTSPNLLRRAFGQRHTSLSLEVTVVNGQITFAIVFPKNLQSFIESQVLATYPDAVLSASPDYLSDWKTPVFTSLIRQTAAAYYPLRDYADYREVDPMLPLLGVLSKIKSEDKILIQFLLFPVPSSVQSQAYRYLHPTPKMDAYGKPIKNDSPEGKKLIEDKLSQPLVGVSIRFAASSKELLRDLAGAISVLNRPDGNSLAPANLFPWQNKNLWQTIRERQRFPQFATTLNVMELSSLWHLPGSYTRISNIAWASGSGLSEPPENLPIPSPDVKEDINFFAQTTYRNQITKFGIRLSDRLRHMYVLGKSGTGKSTMLENMAVDDFKKGRGVAFIDPHGDSAENLLNYIPAHRINDTIYFNPADVEHPIALNILEISSPDQAELVVSGIVAIFHKLYGNSWGPRLEYILRNTLLSLTHLPGSTLADVVTMLTDDKFRKATYTRLTDSHLVSFWKNEFDRLDERTRSEHVAPILNKVGRFVGSPLIRNIISHSKSSINIEDILDSGKILLVNLSQGKLGEDNSALLGAMLITKLELAAMNRVDRPQSERQEFFLYVDEFQNFATESFVKILSEARKFHLGLVLANQYISQIPETIQKAIFGNAGTVISFVIGSADARIMEAEFGKVFTSDVLVNLQKHQIALKMTIDNQVSSPFLATTLPPLKSTNQNKDKVLTISRERWSTSH